jgi:calcineurin-like phosphoesterase family protein
MIFFTSDTHFSHRKILDYESKTRSFSSVEEMNGVLIDNWNSKITNKDIVFHLGDVSFDNEKNTIDIMNQLNGKKILIRGNHDKRLLENKNVRRCFESIHYYYELNHDRKHYVLCHYPFLTWDRSHYGAINLFGHLHSTYFGNSSQLNVGVDCHDLSPISIEEIPQKLNALPNYSDLLKPFFNFNTR